MQVRSYAPPMSIGDLEVQYSTVQYSTVQYLSRLMRQRFMMEEVQSSTSSAPWMSHHTDPNIQYPSS